MKTKQRTPKVQPKGCRWHAVSHFRDFPNGPGCYAIYSEGKLRYLGSAVKLYSRFLLHRQMSTPVGLLLSSGVPLTFKYRDVAKYRDWLMVELRLIYRLQPDLNKKLKIRYVNRPTKTRRVSADVAPFNLTDTELQEAW